MSEEKLPKGWENRRVSDIFRFIGGGTPSKSNANYWNGSIPWASIKDISKVDVIKSTIDSISEEGLANSASNLASKGDLIMGVRMSVGKVVLTEIETAINQDLKILRSVLPNKFSFYWFSHLQKDIENLSSGSTVKGIRLEKLRSLPFPVPPLPEQQRIVAKLDVLFGHLNSLKEKLERIPKLLKNFRQQVLTQAVTGELTKEWREGRNLHNTSELENEILEAKELLIKNMKSKKEKKLTELSDDQKLMTIPSQWFYTKLGKLTAFINGDRGNNYPNRSEYVTEDGVPFINTGHIEPDGSLDVPSMNYITEAKYESLGAGKIRHGDLVYCLRGATLGKTAVITQFNKGAIASSLVIIRPFEGLNNWYLYYFLTSSIGRKYIKLYDNGSAQPNLSAESVRNYVIGLPSIEEQEEIVRRVDALFSLADKIETQYQNLKAKIDQLPQAILAKAFRGELVEQEEKEYVGEAGVVMMAAEETKK